MQVAEMLLELCVTELEDVAEDTETVRNMALPVVQESPHPYTDDMCITGTVRIPGTKHQGHDVACLIIAIITIIITIFIILLLLLLLKSFSSSSIQIIIYCYQSLSSSSCLILVSTDVSHHILSFSWLSEPSV